MNSFMSWIGGKKSSRDIIIPRFPMYYEKYIEVFGGGGWILFGKPPGNDFEVFNDANSNISNLFYCVREHSTELIEKLRYVLNCREDFDKMLHEYGIQYPIRNSWVLYAEYANLGYTQSKTYKYAENKATMHTCWTQRGRLFLYDFLRERGVLPIEVIVTNTGDELLADWSVGYNAGGKIYSIWNAQIYAEQGTEYILRNAGYNSEIAPGQSVSFGYIVSGDSFKFPQNIFNCSKRVDITDNYDVYYNIVGDYGSTYQAEMFIENLSDTDYSAWQLSFDGNATIDSLWNGKLIENNNGSFKVKNAENNPVIYTGNSISFNFGGTRLLEDKDDAEIDTNYDIIFDNYKLTAVEIPIEFDFEYDPELDSDEDGVPDYIERGLGLDRFNPDTDGDGLPDGYEYYYLGTDPAKIDSDDNGISDADEDFDEDGLTNIEEYNLSTNPFIKDSDYDGLSDYDEVYKYNTDPNSHDTDEDKVTDGDEVILGLDPNNPATFGYPDSEYTTEQTVEIDSSALQNINDLEDNPFTISVDITAAGVADNCLTADESGYSYPILQNDAVLGVVPELSYSDGLTVSDVIINFNIVDSAVSDRIGAYSDDPNFDGINRFNVFKYFEEDNILLPVETFYDETENRVYTHVDRVGTYCLIDMEQWVNNLENTEPGNYYIKDEDANEPANIVFCIDTRSIIDDEAFETVKSSIKEIAEDAFDRYVDIKVYIYYQKFGSNFKVTNNLLTDLNTGENYFTDFDSAEYALNGLEKYLIKSNFWAYDYTAATKYMLDTCDENIIAMYHIVSDQRVMGSAEKTKKLLNDLENDERVYVSTICPFSDKAIDDLSYAVAFAEKTNGIVYTQADFISFGTSEEDEFIMPLSESENYMATMSVTNYALFSSDNQKSYDIDKHLEFLIYMKKNIVKILGNGIEKSNYTIISSTGLTEVKLDTVLRPQIYYEVNNIKPTDTDKDNLSDWDEVNIALIKRILKYRGEGSSSRIIKSEDLPTYEEICQHYNGLFYVSGGLNKLLAYIVNSTGGNPYLRLNSLKVLPILSNPVDADGDNDGIPDYCDNNKLYPHNITHDLKTDSGEKYVDTFEILKNLNSPTKVSKKINCKVDVYSLPNSSSKKIYRYGDVLTDISVYSVVKSENCYWLKIKIDNMSNKMGYIMWDETSLDDTVHRIENIIKELGIYHINLPFNRLYESGIGYGEQHIFKTNPEYQGFLMALSDTYDNLNIYRQKGYPINGFVFIGMSFAESGAGIDRENYFGAKFTFDVNNESEKKLIETGKKAVVSTMLKCNLAFSSKDALDLLNEELFYQKAQDLISFLKRRIDERQYDITTNYSSYCIGVANAMVWGNSYLNGSADAHDYTYIAYSVSEIIEKIGPELTARCKIIKD